MEMRPSRDEGGETLVVVRCNDGSIWLDTGNDRLPWRQLAAIPEPTDEEMDVLEEQESEDKERLANAEIERLLWDRWHPAS